MVQEDRIVQDQEEAKIIEFPKNLILMFNKKKMEIRERKKEEDQSYQLSIPPAVKEKIKKNRERAKWNRRIRTKAIQLNLWDSTVIIKPSIFMKRTINQAINQASLPEEFQSDWCS